MGNPRSHASYCTVRCRNVKAAGRIGWVIPGALVARGIDLGDRVQDNGALPRVFLLPRHGVGKREPIAPLLIRFHHPRVVGAHEVVDAAVVGHVAGPRVRMVLVRQDVAATALDCARAIEAAIRAAPRPPFA